MALALREYLLGARKSNFSFFAALIWHFQPRLFKEGNKEAEQNLFFPAQSHRLEVK